MTVFWLLTADEKRQKNVRKQPKVSKMELLFQPQKRGKWGLVFLSSPQAGSGLTFPKRSQIRASPPTPPRLASLRFAYTYTQPRPSAGFRNIHTCMHACIHTYIHTVYRIPQISVDCDTLTKVGDAHRESP